MLGAILKLLLERGGPPDPIRQAFREGKRTLGGWSARHPDLVKLLKTTIKSLPEVFICIDALDECLPSSRRELLESLREIVLDAPATRVLVTGRPHIRHEINRYFTEVAAIGVIPTTRDTRRYLEMKLDRDPTPGAMDDDLRAEIMRVVSTKLSHMYVEITSPGLVGYSLIIRYRFLLVSLNIDAVLKEVTVHRRREKLYEMVQGKSLRGAYSATLARIKAQEVNKSKLGMDVLMWLSHSERPLKANELCSALGVEIGTTDLNTRNIPVMETLLECSLGLVTVEASTNTVNLFHHTLQEYLSANTDLFDSTHGLIAAACLTYLNFQCIIDLSPVRHELWLETPLLEYASCYWGTHVTREITEGGNILALKLLDGLDRHISSRILN